MTESAICICLDIFSFPSLQREKQPPTPPGEREADPSDPSWRAGGWRLLRYPEQFLFWVDGSVRVCVCVSIHSEIFLFLHHHTSSLRLPLSVGGDTSGILRSPISDSALEISLSWKCTPGGRAGHHYDLRSISITDLFHSLTPSLPATFPSYQILWRSHTCKNCSQFHLDLQ